MNNYLIHGVLHMMFYPHLKKKRGHMKKPPGTAASCDTFVAFNRDLPFGRRWLVDFYGSLLNPKLMVFVGLARHLGKLHMVLSNPLCPQYNP